MLAIRDRLREMYGRPVNEPHGHPIAELVRTVLSQNTNDRNRDVAYGRMRERFPTWEQVRDAPPEELEEALRPGGLAPPRRRGSSTILARARRPPRPRLARRGARAQEALDYLTDLPGVGRKTAACVLIFTFDRPEIPVDTHVHRVGGRLGLFRPKRLVRGGPRRDARDHPARGRLRAPHQPDPPRPRDLPPAAPLRRVRPAPDVPLVPRAGGVALASRQPLYAAAAMKRSTFVMFGSPRSCSRS